MFCPECGSTDKKMVGDVCIDCFLKDYTMLTIPEKIEVTICSHCNSKLEEGKWSESNLPEEEIIYRALERNITIDDLVENELIDLEIDQMKGTIAECYVEATGEVYGKEISESHDVDVRILKTVCPTCSKLQAGYYESVIQFRADERELHKWECEKADEIVERTLIKQSKSDKLAYCPQIAKLKEGYDYYIGSLKSGRKIANALKDEFGGHIKESPRLISEDKSTGKGLYRIWISVRIPKFEEGDFIKYENNILQVKDIGKNRVVAINLENDKKHTIPWKDTEEIEVVKKEEDIETTSIISKSPTTIQILDPIDYSVIDLEIKESTKNAQIGDEVKIIKINNYVYLLN